jgi:hypothetical protein
VRRRAPNLYHVDWTAERLLKIEDELTQVEHRPSWLHVDQEIDVAVDSRFSSRDRPEHPHVSSAPTCSNTQDLAPACLEHLQRRRLACMRITGDSRVWRAFFQCHADLSPTSIGQR